MDVALGETDRVSLVRRAKTLSWLTLAYNSVEGIVSISAGLLAGSVALVGFGVDSLIELSASGAALWRLGSDHVPARRERSEQITLRVVGVLFLALALYVAFDAAKSLVRREPPESSTAGIVIAVASLIIMPLLARAKRRIAIALGSRALESEAQQTQLCTYLSAILLGGLLLNAFVGWWWADPVAGLMMVPVIAREGFEGLRGRDPCADGRATHR